MPVCERTCAGCGAAFVARPSFKRYCSPLCRPSPNAAESARIMGLYRESISKLNIAQASMWRHRMCEYLAGRDGRRCAICRRRVDLSLPSRPRGHDMGPSIDHVIPRSQGGSDDLANLRLTHWKCNRARQNRGGGEQLRLVG
ncbi:MAG: HNH endonuclease [Acidimicrobiia bacterium]